MRRLAIAVAAVAMTVGPTLTAQADDTEGYSNGYSNEASAEWFVRTGTEADSFQLDSFQLDSFQLDGYSH